MQIDYFGGMVSLPTHRGSEEVGGISTEHWQGEGARREDTHLGSLCFPKFTRHWLLERLCEKGGLRSHATEKYSFTSLPPGD